ncbi:MAG TPA: glycosyltransferase family 4 protein [Chitinophagaceae bacterium]
MKLILSHPTGNANVRAVAVGFMEADLLYKFHTSIASFSGNMLDIISALGPLKEIRRRAFDSILEPVTKMYPWLEIGRLMSSKARISRLIQHETGPFSIDAVYRNIDRRVASTLHFGSKNGAKAVYAYEDGARCTFKEAKKLGLKCFYELPIGYWRTAKLLLEAEKERWPDWASTITGFDDSETKLGYKDEELLQADRIFVASTFTAKTLKDFPGNLAPVDIIPYGFPEVNDKRIYSGVTHKLKLLFVGSLSQRKGIADLFSAVQAFRDHIELTVVGRKVNDKCPALEKELAKHIWIPSLPHKKVLQLMQQHDVLIFPSLFEGFGLVITEAMAQGTPVITTERTAGPDLIENGNNGWLIEAGSVKELQTIIEKLLCKPQLISNAGKEAMETARTRPWKLYAHELVRSVNKHMGTQY